MTCSDHHRPEPALPYLQWHADADERMKRGERQRKCPVCMKYVWGSFWKTNTKHHGTPQRDQLEPRHPLHGSTMPTDPLERHAFEPSATDDYKCAECGRPRALHKESDTVAAFTPNPE
jgi:endogenous inhibitor of DNA gyrase (YacG/DUF329 family)